MIIDFVREGKAWFRCDQCGAETRILIYRLDDHYDFPVIDNDETLSNIRAFTTLHALCHPDVKQQKLFES